MLVKYLPLKKGVLVHHLNKLRFCSPKDDLSQIWLKQEQWVWRRQKCDDDNNDDNDDK